MLGELLDRSPRRIGPYRTLARLGAGGMGEVYLGADTRPRRPHTGPQLVAVKTVRAELVGDPALRDRFRRETETARSVDSRFTARLLAADADAAEPWLATEYVAGPTLERAVRAAGPLPVETVHRLGLGLVRALRGIHHARVQHRDLKPTSILLGAEGPKVIDFGIARDFGAGTMTATGVMVGSPGYMSPEHVRGGRHVVAASDIFCLASVLCYAASGTPPFGEGPLAAVLYRISQADVNLTGVPDQVRGLIEDCLHPDPSSRPDIAVLEARFRTVTDLPDAADDGSLWPPGVRELVAADEAELAGLLEAAGALAAAAPTMPGAPPVHSAETVTGTPPPPVTPPAGPRSGPRRRMVVAVIAAALAAGVLGAFGLRALEGGGDDGKKASGAASGSPSPSASADIAPGVGLNRYGVDGSRYFPVDSTIRPDGWKPWSAKLDVRPWDCALNRVLLVCRTLDGGLAAVRASDGEPLWNAASPDPGGLPGRGNRGMHIPGNGSAPLIQGDIVVSAEAGMVRGRSAADGEVRWEHDTGLGHEAESVGNALLGDGVAFFTLGFGPSATVYAYDVRTGKHLWKRSLVSHDAPMAASGMYGADAFTEGRLITRTDGGMTAFDARTGEPTPMGVPGNGLCGAVLVHNGHIYCDTEKPANAGEAGGETTVTLDAVTLRPVDEDGPRTAVERNGAEGAVPANGTTYSLRFGADGRVELTPHGPPHGTHTVAPPRKEGEEGGGFPSMDPVIVGDTAVFADNRRLYTLPLDGDERAWREIDGGPGDRDPTGLDSEPLAWAPQVISLGGALFVIYHDGTVRSMKLPA
ncbi:protein kinase domain-containing protein [Streptomyces sp. rh34]|uniref:serine/threonine-protein kinase n=1 Tax=Streptomyces sp. rh34 TaxID=2034272 RepID=UPI0015CF279B|nr:protein kinase [Streptomyces sp. rh34]